MEEFRLVINRSQKKRLIIIARKFKLKLILAFGSAVKEKTHPLSDLDIAIWGQSELTWKGYSNLLSYLEKVFPDKEIDLSFINMADPLLLHKISQSFLCLYGSKKTVSEFLILAFKRYLDYRPFFRLEEKCVTNFITGG